MADPLKIDVHTHILPENWPDLKRKYGYGGFVSLEHTGPGCARMMKDGEHFRDIDDRCWSPESRLRDCEESGVDVQVLSTVPVMFSYWAKPRDTLDLARILNDDLAETVRRNPTRFVGLGTLPMQDAELAIHELDRCVRDLGLAGVQIGSHVNGDNLDDAKLLPIFEKAQECGAAVFVHPWEMLGRERMTKYWLPWLVGMTTETTIAICSVIFGGVLERLPNLRIGFAHGGGSFPGTFGRVQHGFDVRPDLCAVDNDIPPRDYLGRFFVDSLVHDAAALRSLVDFLGANRIALGTDYPFPLGEHVPGALIESIEEFSAETKQRLLGGTALEFLGLEASSFR